MAESTHYEQVGHEEKGRFWLPLSWLAGTSSQRIPILNIRYRMQIAPIPETGSMTETQPLFHDNVIKYQ